MPLGPLTASARRALAPAWAPALGGTALVAVVVVAALLLAVRTEVGNVAADDLPRYVQLAADLGVVPDSEAIEAQVAYDLDTYRDLLDRADVPPADLPQLLLAGEEEAGRLLELRMDQGRIEEEAAAIGGGPWPFPALPPLRLDSPVAVGALVALTALLGAIGLAAAARRVVAGALAALLVAAAVRWRGRSSRGCWQAGTLAGSWPSVRHWRRCSRGWRWRRGAAVAGALRRRWVWRWRSGWGRRGR